MAGRDRPPDGPQDRDPPGLLDRHVARDRRGGGQRHDDRDQLRAGPARHERVLRPRGRRGGRDGADRLRRARRRDADQRPLRDRHRAARVAERRAGGQHALVGGLRAAAQAGVAREGPRRAVAVCRLQASERIPSWALELHEGFMSITRTPDELSIVCPEEAVPPDTTVEEGFRALVLPGPIPFTETGVLASLATPLAAAGISIFAVSTYDTDYVLVRETDLEAALAALGSGRPRRISSGSPFEPVIGFSRAVRVGDRVLVSGTGPVMPDGGCPASTLRAGEALLGDRARRARRGRRVGGRRRAHPHVPHAGRRSRGRDAGPRRGLRRRPPGVDDAATSTRSSTSAGRSRLKRRLSSPRR